MDRAVLARLIARAREEWPAFGVVTNDELTAFIMARIPPERLDDSVLAEDLLLACACTKGVRAAHDALWESASPDIDRAHARIRPPISREEARQLVLDRLLVAGEGGAARIGQYKGDGDLAAFVRAISTRALLNVASGRRAPESLEDSILRSRATDEPDPELALIRKTYLTELRAALALAAAALNPRERALLRYAVVEELGVDAIARMYGVPRTTIAVSIQAAREKLELRVTKHLGERLRVSDRELAKAARCVASQLDQSLVRTLADGTA